jgi:EAL domain-containing protein (putative c-di-GMP-specific phosphodiesterase class I)
MLRNHRDRGDDQSRRCDLFLPHDARARRALRARPPSFSYLKSLPVEYLKIDGQFIRNLEHDLVDQATVRCIRDIARITGKKTIAEFVETETVEALLREIGIDYAQGFLRHRPEALECVFDASGEASA